MWLFASEVSADYYTCPPGIVSRLMLTITYKQAMALHIYIDTEGRFNNHTAHCLYRIMVTTASAVGVMKMGKIVARVGIEPTSLAFRASVLPLHHIGSLMLPLYPHLPVYVALCLRGQCRQLQY